MNQKCIPLVLKVFSASGEITEQKYALSVLESIVQLERHHLLVRHAPSDTIAVEDKEESLGVHLSSRLTSSVLKRAWCLLRSPAQQERTPTPQRSL